MVDANRRESVPMKTLLPYLAGLGMLVAATAQAAHSTEDPVSLAATNLPRPLEKVTSNLSDLETSGYFKITKVEFARTKDFDEEALIWTVKVLKPITCHHALVLLNRVADVRFYRTTKDRELSLFGTDLYYPAWLPLLAIDHRIVDEDREFIIWVLLSRSEARLLQMREADTLRFSPRRR